MGQTAIKTGNKYFSIMMQGAAEAKKYKEAQRKHLPLPRNSR